MSQSGYALLHFFSDAAYNLTGFNISYRSEASVFVSSQTSGPSLTLPGVQTRPWWTHVPAEGRSETEPPHQSRFILVKGLLHTWPEPR